MSATPAVDSLIMNPAKTSSVPDIPQGPPPQFLLFGDSITQCASPIIDALSQRYSRKVDIVSRGFGGYNTSNALAVFPSFFPSVPPSKNQPRILAMTILFGANDSCEPGKPQHCPLEKFREDLRTFCSWPTTKEHKTHVILITPAPVEEYRLSDGDGRSLRIAKYAQVVRDVGEELNVPVFDLWSLIMERTGWNQAPNDKMPGCKGVLPSNILGSLFTDGLHFTNLGYQVFLDGLIGFIERETPGLRAEEIKEWFPEWTQFH